LGATKSPRYRDANLLQSTTFSGDLGLNLPRAECLTYANGLGLQEQREHSEAGQWPMSLMHRKKQKT